MKKKEKKRKKYSPNFISQHICECFVLIWWVEQCNLFTFLNYSKAPESYYTCRKGINGKINADNEMWV